jgi:ferric-dicitrate binding protein FerR (iron transport regulator)
MSDLRWLDDAEDPARTALRQALDESERFTHSELMQRRVWARVSDPARTRRVTRNAFARGALVASALTAFTVVALERVQVSAPAGTRAEVPRAQKSDDASDIALAPKPALAVVAAAGAVVETGAGERLVRILPRGARAELAPRTSVAVDEQGRPELRRGEVRFQVAAADAQRFSVRVASYKVVVAGARFVVKAEAQSVTVAVEDGEAEIWNGSRVVRIGSGETWSSDAAAPRARTGAPRGAHERAPALAPADAESQLAEQDREDLAAARAARAGSDPHRALALYEHLAARTGPAAENALYEIGSIYHDQLKQPAKAVAAWDRYRARYPNGLLRAEADLSVIDTLASLPTADDGMRTLNEALAFLKRYPHSERRGEVSRVVGDLYRERGNYRAALDFYRAVPAAKSGAGAEDADDAAFGQAACLYALRDDGADGALRAYLAQRPHGRHARDASRLLGGERDARDRDGRDREAQDKGTL